MLSLPTADGDKQLVEVDLMLSAHANARAMYENKKLARVKELKTLEVSQSVVLFLAHKVTLLLGFVCR